METLREAIYQVVREIRPATVRQTFYQLVTRGLIAKTETEYKNTVVRLLTEMRLDGVMPFDWLVDHTRLMRKPRTYSSLNAMLEDSIQFYRHSFWHDADVYVEIWLEKDALAGVFYDVTGVWDVPLMTTRGYPSLSFLHSAAETIAAVGKPTFLYYFGDYDPSGMDITRNVEERIREFAPNADILFERVAVTEDQIRGLALPTRPTKATDSRSKHFRNESVEVDAIAPATLRGLVEECVVGHVDPEQLARLQKIEAAERETLRTLAANIKKS